VSRSPVKPLILMYHSISPYEDDPFQITVDPARFREHMQWLHRRGLRGTSVGELLAADAVGAAAGLVGLTFDDGYTDFAEHALPVLAEHGFTATLFALAGRLGGWNAWDEGGPRKSLLTADQLRQVASAGVEIGSHGHAHVRLPSAEPASLQEEIVDSREVLAALTGQEVRGFCYPWGDVAQSTVDLVRSAGYDYACAVQHSALPWRHALPRMYVSDRDRSFRLDLKRLRNRLTTSRFAFPRPHAPKRALRPAEAGNRGRR
jgi:peptidoglycan/xylan/chitin deacetylase (PgdA/CDA1 family)